MCYWCGSGHALHVIKMNYLGTYLLRNADVTEEEMGDLEIYYVAGWGWPLCVLILC